MPYDEPMRHKHDIVVEHHPVSVGLLAVITIPRNGPVCRYPFLRFFKGFEHVPAIQHTFKTHSPAATKKILKKITVEFHTSPAGYMAVNDDDGHLIISANYLRTGNPHDIYLDVIHELVHVQQHWDGKPLFDEEFEYVDRPTEIAAYRQAVQEARRIGYTDEHLYEYLHSSWLSNAELDRLAKHCGVQYKPSLHRPRRPHGSRRKK